MSEEVQKRVRKLYKHEFTQEYMEVLKTVREEEDSAMGALYDIEGSGWCMEWCLFMKLMSAWKA